VLQCSNCPHPILQIDQEQTIAPYPLHPPPVKHSTVVVNHHHIHGTERGWVVGTFVCRPIICRKREEKWNSLQTERNRQWVCFVTCFDHAAVVKTVLKLCVTRGNNTHVCCMYAYVTAYITAYITAENRTTYSPWSWTHGTRCSTPMHVVCH